MAKTKRIAKAPPGVQDMPASPEAWDAILLSLTFKSPQDWKVWGPSPDACGECAAAFLDTRHPLAQGHLASQSKDCITNLLAQCQTYHKINKKFALFTPLWPPKHNRAMAPYKCMFAKSEVLTEAGMSIWLDSFLYVLAHSGLTEAEQRRGTVRKVIILDWASGHNERIFKTWGLDDFLVAWDIRWWDMRRWSVLQNLFPPQQKPEDFARALDFHCIPVPNALMLRNAGNESLLKLALFLTLERSIRCMIANGDGELPRSTLRVAIPYDVELLSANMNLEGRLRQQEKELARSRFEEEMSRAAEEPREKERAEMSAKMGSLDDRIAAYKRSKKLLEEGKMVLGNQLND